MSHSFSPAYFSEKFRKEGVDAIYKLFPQEDIDALPALIKGTPGLLGLNVTIPHKEAVLPYLDSLSADAAAIGAVNCISIDRSCDKFVLRGYNTDWQAFLGTLPHAVVQEKPKALILGSGGASKAVQYALAAAGIAFRIISRIEREGMLGYHEIDASLLADYFLVINTTPLGMHPRESLCPPLPYDALTPKHLLYDLVYNPPLTRFMKEGLARGAQVMNGYAMLIQQAEESWRIWQ